MGHNLYQWFDICISDISLNECLIVPYLLITHQVPFVPTSTYKPLRILGSSGEDDSTNSGT